MSNLHALNRPNGVIASSTILTALAAMLACSVASAGSPNSVTNGSFELNTSFIERPDVPRVADLSGSAPTGWTRDSGDLAEYLTRTPAYLGLTIYNPADGDFFIGAHDGEWWQQTFATSAGTEYVLTFSGAYGSVWWTAIPGYYRPGVLPGYVTVTGTTELLRAEVAGASAAPDGSALLDQPFVWSQYQFSFVADSNFTTLRFAGSDVADGGFIFVDNVTVAAVPELQTVWLALLGLPGVLLARKAGGREGTPSPHSPTVHKPADQLGS